MTQERWQKVEEIYHAALERAPEQRAGYVAGACGSDVSLQQEVVSLLDRDASSPDLVLNRTAAAPVRQLAQGMRLGPYEVLAPLGAGGMGEVWEARDVRLDRTVAIKVSSREFSERFGREARAIASLNHPHICQVYDVGPNYLVMERVEGSPLKGPLPLEKTIEYALQICDALEAAHRKGIVHRDLKPANILLSRRAGIKLLDFGLAKRAANGDAGNSANVGITAEGKIVGTVRYMSPEQLQGKETDARSDIFSFGLVLYEMLTGQVAFPGENSANVMAAILTAEPAPLAPAPPLWMDRVVKTCLAKEPEARFQTARDLRRAIEWGGETTAAVTASSSGAGRRLPWLVAGVFAGIALWLGVARFTNTMPMASTVKFAIPAPDRQNFGFSTLSPNGRTLIFSGGDRSGNARLWIRSLDSLAATPLPGGENGERPFWAPDGRSVAFFAGRTLRRVDPWGHGVGQTICNVDSFQGGAWAPDGTVLFSRNLDSIYRVPAAGGDPVRFTELDAAHKESRHYWPRMLPDGRHFLYVVISSMPDVRGIWVASLDNAKEKHRILPEISSAAYSDGYLLFARSENLMAQPFDLRTLQVQGDAVPVVEHVDHHATVGWADFSVSETGAIAMGASARSMQMTWFDRTGKSLGGFGKEGIYQQMAFSPDQTRVAADGQDASGYQIFVFDPARGATTVITSGEATGNFPVWSPDGSRIAFASARDGVYDLYVKASSGAGGDELLLKNDRNKFISDWSHDGRYLIYGEQNPATKSSDLWVLPMTGERKPQLFVKNDFDKRDSVFSPDGQWVAYSSAESTGTQVYVQPFPTGSARVQVSVDGGGRPRWRDDGKELFYLTPGGGLMAVKVKLGKTFEAGTPERLFETGNTNELVHFAPARGGQRFLLPSNPREPAPVTVILNWSSALKHYW